MVINIYGCGIHVGRVFVRLMGVALVPEAVPEKLEPMVRLLKMSKISSKFTDSPSIAILINLEHALTNQTVYVVSGATRNLSEVVN